MTTTRTRTLLAAALTAAAISLLPAAPALAAAPAVQSHGHSHAKLTPSQVLASTPWKTTGAVDQAGNAVALDNPAVANFVGWAYFKTNGSFTMYNLDDSPKMHGDWSVAADGSTRTITARDAAGNPLFTRVVPITVLTKREFTYRITPDAANPGVYYDIIHTPTKHREPGTEKPGKGHGHGKGHAHGAGHQGHSSGHGSHRGR